MASETRVTPWAAFGHYGLSHVRIWAKLTEFGMWQRHEWRRDDGSTSVDRWIPSSGRSWPVQAQRTTPEPTDLEALIAALRAIAAGHNDARTVAQEALIQIGQST